MSTVVTERAQAGHRAGSRLYVADSVVDSDAAARITDWHSEQDISQVWAAGHGIRTLFDGVGHFGPTRIWSTESEPTGDVVADLIVATIRHHARNAAELIGVEGSAWSRFTLTPWVHPAGSQLGWHTDKVDMDNGARRVGAFVWYVHPHWETHWGGELSVVDAPAASLGAEPGESLSTVTLRGPDPLAVLCRPNRLIVFPTDTYHMVRRVDAAAGDRPRCTLTGFFST